MQSAASQWYSELKKPSFSPPAWIFTPVWAVLYGIIGISFGTVCARVFIGTWPPMTLAPFLINIAANLLFPVLQFRLRNTTLAFIDIVIVLVSIVEIIIVMSPVAPWIAWAQTPYLLWIGFATILQGTIAWMNRGR